MSFRGNSVQQEDEVNYHRHEAIGLEWHDVSEEEDGEDEESDDKQAIR